MGAAAHDDIAQSKANRAAAWLYVKCLVSGCIAASAVDAVGGRDAGVFAYLVGGVTFLAALIAVSLLGVAVRHPLAAAKAVGWMLLVALGLWALESGLEAMSVKALLAVVIVLLLFRT